MSSSAVHRRAGPLGQRHLGHGPGRRTGPPYPRHGGETCSGRAAACPRRGTARTGAQSTASRLRRCSRISNLRALRRPAVAPSTRPRRPPSPVSAPPRASAARHARPGILAVRSGMTHHRLLPMVQIPLARTIRSRSRLPRVGTAEASRQPGIVPAFYKWSIHGSRNRQRRAFQDDKAAWLRQGGPPGRRADPHLATPAADRLQHRHHALVCVSASRRSEW